MALYTWSSDFSNKKGTKIIKDSLITDDQKAAFQAKVDAYCPSHNAPNTATDNNTTGGCNYSADCSYSVCGCGNDSADPAIGGSGIAYCTSN